MRLLDRLRGATRGVPPVHLEGRKSVNVVGTQHYTGALQRVVKANPEHRTETGASRVAFTATLVPERNNRYDSSAVAVLAGRQTIGHLSRDDAASYRPALDRLAATGATVTAEGLIYAGHKGGSSWSVGVKLPKPAEIASGEQT